MAAEGGLFLQTTRLDIKFTSRDDFENILQLRSDPDVQRYTVQHGYELAQPADIEKFLDNIIPYQKTHGFGMCSVFLKGTKTFIGQGGIFHIGHYERQPEIEIGYRLHKAYWGQGYGSELCAFLKDWFAKNLNTSSLVAFTETDNIASRKILEKNAFVHLGLKESYYGLLERYEWHKK